MYPIRTTQCKPNANKASMPSNAKSPNELNESTKFGLMPRETSLFLNTTDDTLKEFYGKYGTILDSVVMRDGATKKSRGFGFITYSAKTEVDSAMTSRPHVIDGKTVDPKRAVPRDQSSRGEANVSTQRLYVSGVREDHQEQQFKDYFGDYGTVTKVEIITDKASGKPRGFGFITFDDYDAVDKCVLAKSHMINGFRCDVKKALSRDEMAKAQQSDRDRMDRGMRTRGGNFGGPWTGNRGGSAAGNFREPHGYSGGSSGGGWSNQNWQGQGQWNSGGGYGNAPQQYGGPAGQWSGGNDNWNNSQQGGGYNQWGQQGGYQQQAPQGWGGNNSNNWKGGNRY